MNERPAHVVNPDGVTSTSFVQLPDGRWTNTERITLALGGFVTIQGEGGGTSFVLQLESRRSP
jgi:hypothetical protein